MTLEERKKIGEAAFERTLRRLLLLPGKVEVGTTSDTGDRYLAWYPFPDKGASVEFILFGGWHNEESRWEIETRSNLTWAEE